MHDPEQLNELLKLGDDALVNTHEAAAVVGLAYNTLTWYRTYAPERSPKYVCAGRTHIRYRMGDLRAYISGREG